MPNNFSTNELASVFDAHVESKKYVDATKLGALIELAIEDTEGFLPDVNAGVDFFSRYLITFLIIDDLDGARHLWRRLPPIFKGEQHEISAIWLIGKALWEQDMVAVRSVLERQQQWSPRLSVLISDLKNAIVGRVYQQIIKAYSLISVDKLKEFLLCSSTENALEECVKLGWEISADRLNVHPRPVAASSPVHSGINDTVVKIDNAETIQILSEYVAHFEKKTLKVDLNSGSTGTGTAGASASSSSSTVPTSVPYGGGSSGVAGPRKTGTK